jgi:GntR family transcriptional regulator
MARRVQSAGRQDGTHLNAGGGVERLANRSLSDRARETLLAAIEADAFPGGRLPPEAELSELVGVSRTTLRAALTSLEADGVVSRRRGRGTFVNAHLLRSTMRLNRLIPFTALIAQCGHEPSVDPQQHRFATVPAAAAEPLGVEPDTACLLVERLLRAGGEPVIRVSDAIPLERLRVAPSELQEADSTFTFVARNCVAPIDYATAELVPRVAGASDPTGLGLRPGVPYVELVEAHFSRDHEPIAFSRVSVDDRYVRLSLLRRDA